LVKFVCPQKLFYIFVKTSLDIYNKENDMDWVQAFVHITMVVFRFSNQLKENVHYMREPLWNLDNLVEQYLIFKKMKGNSKEGKHILYNYSTVVDR
jgi:adenine C2-methylase RlmN of 23S rRNA A2503 and tRNA A37